MSIICAEYGSDGVNSNICHNVLPKGWKVKILLLNCTPKTRDPFRLAAIRYKNAVNTVESGWALK